MIGRMGENPGNVFWPSALNKKIQSPSVAMKPDALAKLYSANTSHISVFNSGGLMTGLKRPGGNISIKI